MGDQPIHPFDRALALRAVADGRYEVSSSAEYWNMNGPFGGLTCATALHAALQHAPASMEPVSLTVNFCAPQKPGLSSLQVREIRRGKWTSHLLVRMRAEDGTDVVTATVVCGVREPGFSHQVVTMPTVAPPHELPSMPADPRFAWLQQYDFRFVSGALRLNDPQAIGQRNAGSILWVRDRIPRPLDRLSLAALCDVFFLRVFHVRQKLALAGTVTLTAQFHASDEDLARQSDRHILGVADASTFTRQFFDQQARLWSDDGTLLATTTQLGWFQS